MYVNNVKLPPRTATTVKPDDEICFGVNLENNELRYKLTVDSSRRPVLKRCGSNDTSQASNEESEGSQCSSFTSQHEIPLPTKKPRRDTDDPIATEHLRGMEDSQPKAVAPETSSPIKRLGLPSPKSTVSTQSGPGSQLSVDAIFSEGIDNKESLSQAIFGDDVPEGSSRAKSMLGLDATTIQIQFAEEQMDKERHKLLSNIEALKSELEAKEQLLAKQQDAAEDTKNCDKSMLLFMQEEFTCVICQELFIRTFTLPCSHSFCELCIKEWIKGKRQRDCPICRKKITADPVHSLVLDNAILKIVEKLGPEERKEREKVTEEHKNALLRLNSSSATTKAVSSATSSSTSAGHTGVTTRRSAMYACPPVVVISTPHHPTTSHSTTSSRPIVISDEDEESSSSLDSFIDDSDVNSDSDSYDEGLPGATYGGYGRCFRCGKLVPLVVYTCRLC